MQEGIILDGEKLKVFCEEMNIKSKPSKILIKINDGKAEYYNTDDECFYELDFELDFEVVKKYI